MDKSSREQNTTNDGSDSEGDASRIGQKKAKFYHITDQLNIPQTSEAKKENWLKKAEDKLHDINSLTLQQIDNNQELVKYIKNMLGQKKVESKEYDVYNEACNIVGMINMENSILKERGLEKWKKVKNLTDENSIKILSVMKDAVDSLKRASSQAEHSISRSSLQTEIQLYNELFENQELSDIFPNIREVNNKEEKDIYSFIMRNYAEILKSKTEEIYSVILESARNKGTKIYYRWYGNNSAYIRDFVAFYDKNEDQFYIGPTKSSLRQFGISESSFPSDHVESLKQASIHLKANKEIRYATYEILRPLLKISGRSKKDENKVGPIGLYVTDNYARLAEDFGGDSGSMSMLYSATRSTRTTGPWTLPEGAVRSKT